jgi:hypothetical protein
MILGTSLRDLHKSCHLSRLRASVCGLSGWNLSCFRFTLEISKLRGHMKLPAFAILLISGLAFAQTTKSPGHPSRYASVGRKNSGGTVNPPKTNSLASELAKIEQQGAHAQASTASQRAAGSTHVAPKTPPPTQNKNKPTKFSYKPPQGSHITQPH